MSDMKKSSGDKNEWAGYTMEDIQYQRAITLARIAVAHERLNMDVEHIKKGNIFFSGSFFTRIMKVIDYSDFFVIGLSLWRKIRPLFSRRKK